MDFVQLGIIACGFIIVVVMIVMLTRCICGNSNNSKNIVNYDELTQNNRPERSTFEKKVRSIYQKRNRQYYKV